MNSLRHPSVAFALIALLFSAVFPARALDDLLITELMAVNDNTLADEDGDFQDWVESTTPARTPWT
jgi:hypothetical protein